MNDDTLARRAAAFTELYRRHLQRVYAYHYARTGNQADAQDLTSQTFMAALENIARYRGPNTFAAWLLTIARNKLTDHYRTHRPTADLDDEHPDTHSLEDSTISRLQLSQIANALSTLTPDRAEALTLRIFANLSAAEAARVMGKTEAAVKMLVHRALQDLKAILVKEEIS
jgi:RNA polymerase sigma-70 factor (ECF subfamily)